MKKYDTLLKKVLKEIGNKQVGEFECPICESIFFTKKQLMGHIGGKHKKKDYGDADYNNKSNKYFCKKCGSELIPGKNFAMWAQKNHNLICISCKRIQNRISYRNRKLRKKDK